MKLTTYQELNDPIMGKAKYKITLQNGKWVYIYQWHVEHGFYQYYKSQKIYTIERVN